VLDSCFFNLEQNDFKKLYRAKAPRTQSKIFFYCSELGVLCAFARAISFPILQAKQQAEIQIYLARVILNLPCYTAALNTRRMAEAISTMTPIESRGES